MRPSVAQAELNGCACPQSPRRHTLGTKIGASSTDFPSRAQFLQLSGFAADSDVFVKLEGCNPTGSIKIKPARAMIDAAEEAGLALPGRSRFIESSSGNMGLAMSAVCAERGYDFVCVTDPAASPATLRGIRAYGGEVVIVEERDENGGFVGTRIREIERRRAAAPDLVWLNQYEHAANARSHATTTGPEILAAIPAPDWLFVGVGTGGTLMGLADVFARESPQTRFVAVDPVGSVTFGHAPGRRAIPGIGNSRVPRLLDPTRPHHVVRVSETETVAMCRTMARRYAVLLGGSSGSALAAVRKAVGQFRPGDSVVVIAPDFGERYLDTIYDDGWVAAHVGDWRVATEVLT